MDKFTDQYFTYRQTPVSYDGIGNITRIKGNTLVWNQLQSTPTSTSGTVSGVSASVTNGVVKITGTASATGNITIVPSSNNGGNIPANHVLLMCADGKGDIRVRRAGFGAGASNNYVFSKHTTDFYCSVYLYVENGKTYDVEKQINVFDLTTMFGSTKADEIYAMEQSSRGSGVAYFKSLFPLDYYPYDSGSLLSFMGSGIKTANADESKESTTDLPVLTYFPTGMKSAGSVYDELTPSKAITRVGELVFDGVHNNIWSGTAVTNNVRRFYTTPVFKANVKVLADKLTDGNASTLNSIFGTSDGRIVITPSGVQSLTTVAELQTWLSSNPLDVYYELATESEQDINTKMLYPIYADGTEQILPTSDTSPFFGDIEYYNGTEGETNIRKFWLINGENERWDLTEKEFKAFLNNPQGLGFRKTVESVRYGERQNKVSEAYNFPSPQGELLFYDSYNSTRYDKYNKFIRFLMNQPITLYYMIPVSYISGIANIYTLDCEVTEVQKTESKTDNILRSSIVFNGMEFYKGDPITVNGTGTSYTLTNDGDFPVGFEITVEGSLTNPYVTLSQDGELYGEAKFDSETAFSSVYVNSNDGEQNVVLMQNDAIIPNPLSYQDLSISNGSIYVTFVKLARGDSTLEIGMESGSLTSVKIEFTPMYRSV